jgi:tetratricopeptide (TPR) repeat protein
MHAPPLGSEFPPRFHVLTLAASPHAMRITVDSSRSPRILFPCLMYRSWQKYPFQPEKRPNYSAHGSYWARRRLKPELQTQVRHISSFGIRVLARGACDLALRLAVTFAVSISLSPFRTVATLLFFSCCAWADPIAFPEFKVETARDYLLAVSQALQAQGGTNADLGFMQARLLTRLGRHDEAEQSARRALAQDPNRADIQSFLADLFIRQDRLADAAVCLRQALQLDPNLAGGYRRLGMVLDNLGNHEEARQTFETGLRLNPQDATGQLLLGRLLLDQGQTKEAAVHLEAACQVDPESANAFYVLSQAQAKLGNREAAQATRKTFETLKEKEKAALDAENAAYDDEKAMRTLASGFHLDAASYYLQQQALPLAEAHLRQAVIVAPQDPRAREMLAAFYMRSGQMQAARAASEDLVRLWPKQVSYRVNFGTLLLQLKDFPAAVGELKQALELDPKQPEALNNLVRFDLGTRRDLPGALVLCRRLVDVQPTSANYDLLGWALYVNGQTKEALAASARAVELEPTNTVYREHHRRLSQASAEAH